MVINIFIWFIGYFVIQMVRVITKTYIIKGRTDLMKETHKELLIKSLQDEVQDLRNNLEKISILSSFIMVLQFIAISFFLIKDYL